MKLFTRFTLLSAAIASLVAVTPDTFAQQNPPGGGGGGGGQGGGGGGQRGQRGNFDPAQMQERMMSMYRERLEITNDDEWKAIQPMVQKITEARRDVGSGFGRGMMRPPGGQGGPGGGGNGGRRGFGGEPSAEETALEKAIESKAPAAELKSAIAKFRESKKAKEAKLAAAQDELRKVLTVRQEAQAVLAGLLN